MGFGLYLINELKINGQTVDDNDDFNVEDETQTDAEKQNENPEDVAQNAAEDAAEDQKNVTTETEPQQDNNDELADDPEDDFTIDDTDEADTTATEAEDESDDDFTVNTGDGGTEDTTTDAGADTTAPAEDGTDDGANDDFTVTGDEDGGGEKVSNSGDDDNTTDGDNTTQQTQNASAKQAPADPTDSISDDEDRAAEEAIYDSLTDDQKRIRVLQLKLDYKDLYETISTALEGINNIPKNSDNIESIKRLIMLLTKARNILIDYIENNFDTNPYLENYTMYIKYMAVFRTASKVIEELNPH